MTCEPRRTGRTVILVLCVALLGVTATAWGSESSPLTPSDVVPDQYVVSLRDGPASHAVADEHRRHGARPLHVYGAALGGYAARMSPEAAERIAADPRVASVEPDRVVSLAAQELPTGVDRVDAEDSPVARIDGVDQRVNVDIAVLDTGIQADHPDLRVVGGTSCVAEEPGWRDRNGHGTHAAGIAAAKDNDIGVVGVAPGARLHAVKVLNQGGQGTWSSLICGINWVTDTTKHRPIEVANLSLGGWGDDGDCSSSTLHQAICTSVASGVTYTVAAGNGPFEVDSFVPATYREVITVSALADSDGKPGSAGGPTCDADADDTFAAFSNYGPDVDFIAPGSCIRSTYVGGTYAEASGTSMAAPHVAGGAALYKARHPTASPAQVKKALRAAGTYDWEVATDPDAIGDRLLDVASLHPSSGRRQA